MTIWQHTPSGASGVLYGVKATVTRMTSGVLGAFRVTMEGVPASDLPNEGVVSSLSIGKTLAFDTLKALNASAAAARAKAAAGRPAPGTPPPQAPHPPPTPQDLDPLDLRAQHELRAKALGLAVNAVNGALCPLSGEDAAALSGRLRAILQTADLFGRYLVVPAVTPVANPHR